MVTLYAQLMRVWLYTLDKHVNHLLMNFSWSFTENNIILEIEDRFTLLDFIFLFATILLGLLVSGVFLAFSVGYVAKIFSRNLFEFNIEKKRLQKYVYILGFIRLKLSEHNFSEIKQFTYTNYDLGNPFWPVSWINQQTYSIIIESVNSITLLAKVQESDKESTEALFEEMEHQLQSYFHFRSEFLG